MKKIGVIGGSGFVGSALCERLFFEGIAFTAFVRGSAPRVSRLSVPIQRLDLLQRETLADKLAGHDVVVNCAMLGDKASVSNLLRTVERLTTPKFIHLSSLSIYGREPKPDCITEEGRPDPQGNEYAEGKLWQDEAAFRLHRKGIATYILCPHTIVGPYSVSFPITEMLRAGPMPLVDGGENPCNLVHVDNLVEAILASIRCSGGAGERYFVNETRPVTWRRVLEDHARVLGIRPEFVNVTSAQVRPFIPTRRRVHFKDRAKVLVAPDFRRLASQLPVLGTLNGLASSTFHRLPEKTQNRIRERLQWPISVGRPRTDLTLDSRLARAQLATHYHSPNKLITRLGWKPPLSYEAGIETIGEWLKFAGMTRQEPLTRERKSALHGGVGENVAA